jgi:hypothetical protein
MEEDFIAHWSRRLRLSPRRRRAITRELRSHLVESRRELELSGLPPRDAAHESLRRLGDPAEIAEAFTKVHRRSPRQKLGLAFALSASLMLGVYGVSGTFASSPSHAQHASHPHLQRSQPVCHHHA